MSDFLAPSAWQAHKQFKCRQGCYYCGIKQNVPAPTWVLRPSPRTSDRQYKRGKR